MYNNIVEKIKAIASSNQIMQMLLVNNDSNNSSITTKVTIAKTKTEINEDCEQDNHIYINE